MKVRYILFIVLLSCVYNYAQVQTLWAKTSAAGTLPTWFGTANTERGMCYGNNGKLYVVSRNAGTFVRVVNALTGEDAGTLSTVGVSSGTFLLNEMESTEDGVLYGLNLSNSLADTVKIYKWDNETANPKVVFASTFDVDKRIGDNFTIVGKYNDNSFSVWFADVKNNNIYVLKKTGASDDLSIVRTISLPAATLGSAPSVYPLLSDSMVVIKSAGRYVQAYSYDGELQDQIPGTIIGTGSTATKLFEMGDMGYLATFQYTSANVRIVDTDGGEIGGSNFRTYAITTALGTNANANGTGDIAFVNHSDTAVTMFTLGTNNGIAAYRITRPYMVNGRFHEGYNRIADAQNQNVGFGSKIKIKNIRYSVANNKLYLALSASVDQLNNQGVILFLGLKDKAGSGAAAGTALGGVSGIGNALGNTTNSNFKNDFETHYAFYLSSLATDTAVYVDVAKYTGTTKQGIVLGRAKQEGSAAQGPEVAGFFTANSITFAFDTAFSKSRGFEIAIPFGELGITTFNGLEAFAVAVTNAALFSNITVPGNITTGNPQANPNFANLSGGPYHVTVNLSTPVELVSFNAIPLNNTILIQWQTASELNNDHFIIERSLDGKVFSQIAKIKGNGSTVGKSDYQFIDNDKINSNKVTYRLYQKDFDGSISLIGETSVLSQGLASTYSLEQNYPNPFNPETKISFNLPSDASVRLSVFNTLGQEVAVVVDGKLSAGFHSVVFNAEKIGSGVYFYKLSSNNMMLVKKMIVLQ